MAHELQLYPFRITVALTAGMLAGFAACSTDHPPAGFTPVDASDVEDARASDSGSDAANEASIEAGGNADASDGGGGTDGGDTGSDTGPVVAPNGCPTVLNFGSATKLGVSTASPDRFGSISLDENSIAWTENASGTPTVHYADKNGASFGVAKTLAGSFALDRAAIGSTGLRLMVVNADRRAFSVFSRAAVGDDFVLEASSTLVLVYNLLGPSDLLGDPVFLAGDQVLYYSLYGGGNVSTVRFASRLSVSSAWYPGGAFAFSELQEQAGKRRHPTGVSSDSLTLFFFDEVSGTEKAGVLNGVSGFTSVTDLGARTYAQPNELCTRIYYSDGADLYSADRL